MKLKHILEAFLNNQIVKQLERINKTTWPKIPCGNVFLNDVEPVSYANRIDADKLFDNDEYLKLPAENININKIIPTQTNLTINNLKRIDNLDGIYLLNMGTKYYVLDGHHRIAVQILNGKQMIKCRVYEN